MRKFQIGERVGHHAYGDGTVELVGEEYVGLRFDDGLYFETPDRLGWRLRYGDVIFYPDAPGVDFSLTPVFFGCSEVLAQIGIVWNLWALIESCRRPGAFSILNCECGIPDDAGLKEFVFVSHPNDEIVVWELDIKGLSPALDDWIVGQPGFIRYLFEREAYEMEIRAMLREVQRVAEMPVPLADLPGERVREDLERQYPGIHHVTADRFEPTIRGDCDADDFCGMDADAAWLREPMFPPGTLIEIGFFGEYLYRIDGKTRHVWLGRWFTRWVVQEAFKAWLEHVLRRFALATFYKDAEPQVASDVAQNVFVLLPGFDLESCHRVGERFAEIMRHSLLEGTTAPEVTIRYVRRDPPQAVLKQVGGQ